MMLLICKWVTIFDIRRCVQKRRVKKQIVIGSIYRLSWPIRINYFFPNNTKMRRNNHYEYVTQTKEIQTRSRIIFPNGAKNSCINTEDKGNASQIYPKSIIFIHGFWCYVQNRKKSLRSLVRFLIATIIKKPPIQNQPQKNIRQNRVKEILSDQKNIQSNCKRGQKYFWSVELPKLRKSRVLLNFSIFCHFKNPPTINCTTDLFFKKGIII